MGIPTKMTGKSIPEIKLGATVRLRAQSGEIIDAPVRMLVGETKAE
jgi:hypothetical protein